MAGDALGSLRAGDVRHLFKTLQQLVERTPHRLVDVARSLAAAGDEQAARRHVGRAREESFTQWHASQLNSFCIQTISGARQRRAHDGRAAREETRRQSRPHVLLMQDVRDLSHARGRHRRRHHVAAHAEHDIGLEAVDDGEPGAQRHGDDRRQGEVLPRRVAVEAAHVDRGQIEAGPRHQPLLGTALAPDQQESAIWLLSAKRVRDGERRIQVPTGPAASYQQPHLSSSYAQIRCPNQIARRSGARLTPPGSSPPPCRRS